MITVVSIHLNGQLLLHNAQEITTSYERELRHTRRGDVCR